MLRAADKPKAILSAGVLLDKLKWEVQHNGIWKTEISSTHAIDDWYTNGKKLIKARYPYYNPNILPYNGYASDAIAKERVKTWKNQQGGDVHALHQGKWGDFIIRLEEKIKMVI